MEPIREGDQKPVTQIDSPFNGKMPKPKAMSATAVKALEGIARQTKEELVSKMCDHLLDSRNDIENAVNTFLQDAALYPLFSEPAICDILVILAKEVDKKFYIKYPRR